MRLFVALVPPPAVLGGLDAAVAPLRILRPGLRWTTRDAWHITLAFLGETSETAAARLMPRLERAAGRHRPLDLMFAAAGAFPDAARARVLWCGLRGDHRDVVGLAASVAAATLRRRAPGECGPPVPPAPHAGSLPCAGRCPRPRRCSERVSGAALECRPHPSHPQSARRPATLRDGGQLAARPGIGSMRDTRAPLAPSRRAGAPGAHRDRRLGGALRRRGAVARGAAGGQYGDGVLRMTVRLTIFPSLTLK